MANIGLKQSLVVGITSFQELKMAKKTRWPTSNSKFWIDASQTAECNMFLEKPLLSFFSYFSQSRKVLMCWKQTFLKEINDIFRIYFLTHSAAILLPSLFLRQKFFFKKSQFSFVLRNRTMSFAFCDNRSGTFWWRKVPKSKSCFFHTLPERM